MGCYWALHHIPGSEVYLLQSFYSLEPTMLVVRLSMPESCESKLSWLN